MMQNASSSNVLLRALHHERKQDILVAIHDLSLAARFATRVVLLRHGRKLAECNWQTALNPAAFRNACEVGVKVALLRGMPFIASCHAGHSL
jgi:ABC-type hemin transport system ATPase subunit